MSFNPKTKCGTLVYLDVEFEGDEGDDTTAAISDLGYLYLEDNGDIGNNDGDYENDGNNDDDYEDDGNNDDDYEEDY